MWTELGGQVHATDSLRHQLVIDQLEELTHELGVMGDVVEEHDLRVWSRPSTLWALGFDLNASAARDQRPNNITLSDT